jgi:hypothetical protein
MRCRRGPIVRDVCQRHGSWCFGSGFQVVLVRDAHATYNLDDIPAAIVSRVAEHALGDEVELTDATSVTFCQSTMAP